MIEFPVVDRVIGWKADECTSGLSGARGVRGCGKKKTQLFGRNGTDDAKLVRETTDE
jgi:hypothetical protein